ncbi:hypothetical protein M0812_08134 [Anaeramoeba flamelloides]|uniref:Uncharacterized protein n=1 Tax=Anaeramoeba flamelloides TaxID=1746091 RepID=A0AAV8A3I2_9EUKA|nr:hypothetical protein M0812_08134 [Anaeramoeba flamelloides]
MSFEHFPKIKHFLDELETLIKQKPEEENCVFQRETNPITMTQHYSHDLLRHTTNLVELTKNIKEFFKQCDDLTGLKIYSKHIDNIKELIKQSKEICNFKQPQFESKEQTKTELENRISINKLDLQEIITFLAPLINNLQTLQLSCSKYQNLIVSSSPIIEIENKLKHYLNNSSQKNNDNYLKQFVKIEKLILLNLENYFRGFEFRFVILEKSKPWTLNNKKINNLLQVLTIQIPQILNFNKLTQVDDWFQNKLSFYQKKNNNLSEDENWVTEINSMKIFIKNLLQILMKLKKFVVSWEKLEIKIKNEIGKEKENANIKENGNENPKEKEKEKENSKEKEKENGEENENNKLLITINNLKTNKNGNNDPEIIKIKKKIKKLKSKKDLTIQYIQTILNSQNNNSKIADLEKKSSKINNKFKNIIQNNNYEKIDEIGETSSQQMELTQLLKDQKHYPHYIVKNIEINQNIINSFSTDNNNKMKFLNEELNAMKLNNLNLKGKYQKLKNQVLINHNSNNKKRKKK